MHGPELPACTIRQNQARPTTPRETTLAQMKCLFAFTIHVEKGFACAFHDHPCTEIVCTGESAGTLYDGQKQFPFGPHQIFTYQPTGHHHVRIAAGGTQLCIGVRGCGAELLPVGVWPMSETTSQIHRQCLAAMNGPDLHHETRLDLLAGLLVTDLRSSCEGQQARPSAPDIAQQARQIIDTRFDDKLSLRDLASELYISPDYLRQLFRKRFGQSPIHYLIRKRIEAAEELLTTSNTAIRDIGERCGFDNPYYFSRMFRKVTGKRPSDYRTEKHGATRKIDRLPSAQK